MRTMGEFCDGHNSRRRGQRRMGFGCGWLGACVVTIYEVCWGGQILSWLVIFYRGLLKGVDGQTF